MSIRNGEPVTFLRPGTTTDPYSNQTVDDWSTAVAVHDDEAAVEPIASEEPLQDGRQAVIVGFRLYFDHLITLDRLWRVELRGERYEIQGRPAEWRSPFTGWHAGTVVQIGMVGG